MQQRKKNLVRQICAEIVGIFTASINDYQELIHGICTNVKGNPEQKMRLQNSLRF
jgi:hypothetical protein